MQKCYWRISDLDKFLAALQCIQQQGIVAMMDYDESPEAFQILQLMSLPSVFHFSVKRKFMPGDVYHSEGRGITAEHMAKCVAARTERRETNTTIRQPTDDHDPSSWEYFWLLLVDLCIYGNGIGNLFLTNCGQRQLCVLWSWWHLVKRGLT